MSTSAVHESQLQLLKGILDIYKEIFANQLSNDQTEQNLNLNKYSNKQDSLKSTKTKGLKP